MSLYKTKKNFHLPTLALISRVKTSLTGNTSFAQVTCLTSHDDTL